LKNNRYFTAFDYIILCCFIFICLTIYAVFFFIKAKYESFIEMKNQKK